MFPFFEKHRFLVLGRMFVLLVLIDRTLETLDEEWSLNYFYVIETPDTEIICYHSCKTILALESSFTPQHVVVIAF